MPTIEFAESYPEDICNDNEVFREINAYIIDGKWTAMMISIMTNDGYVRSFNVDFDTMYNFDESIDIPTEILEYLESDADKRTKDDYERWKNHENN